MKNLWFAFIKVTRKYFCYHISFLLTMFSQNVAWDIFCNNSFDVKTIKFNRFHNWKTFLFHISFKVVWSKREIKNISSHYLFMKTHIILYFRCDTHSNISEILILLEYFRNMYRCHKHFTESWYNANVFSFDWWD